MIENIIEKKTSPPKVIIIYKIEDVDEVILNLNKNIPLIVNVMNLDSRSAYRMIDFLSGYCYAKKGNYRKIDKMIYRFEL